MNQAIPLNNKLLNQLYTDYMPHFFSEQALISDLSKHMYDDSITYFNLNEIENAETTVVALTNWICRDVQYFINQKDEKQKLYEYDVVASLQLLGQLINMCEDFKQYTIAYKIQKEYSKLNIKYSLMQAA